MLRSMKVSVLIVLVSTLFAGVACSSPTEGQREQGQEQAKDTAQEERITELESELSSVQKDLGLAEENLEIRDERIELLESQIEQLRAENEGIQAENEEVAQTPNVQQPEGADTKQVTIEISSDVPVDVNIIDDNFDVNVAEEIAGSKTYEYEIAADSGLIVGAVSENIMRGDMSGNVSIAVYENGELIAEDTSSRGSATVMY